VGLGEIVGVIWVAESGHAIAGSLALEVGASSKRSSQRSESEGDGSDALDDDLDTTCFLMLLHCLLFCRRLLAQVNRTGVILRS
jgi:hypothetical protein